MANEKRLIYANALFEGQFAEAENEYQQGWNDALLGAFLAIEEVDAVEVIRCKDCKAYDKEGYYCEAMGFTCEANDFCSYGERKDNDD